MNLSDDKVLGRIVTAGVGDPDNIQRVRGYPDDRISRPGYTPRFEFVGEILALGSSVKPCSSGRNPWLRPRPSQIKLSDRLPFFSDMLSLPYAAGSKGPWCSTLHDSQR